LIAAILEISTQVPSMHAHCRRLLPIALLVVATFLLPRPLCAGDSTERRYALIVGVKNYKKDQFRSLLYSENDADDLAAVFKEAGYKRVVILTGQKGSTDVDLTPTAKNIRAQLSSLLEDRKETDTVVVAFSGHGVQFKDGSGHFFCPSDADLADRTTLISLKAVYEELKKSKARVKLLLVDACRNDPLAQRRSRALASVELESKTRPQKEEVPGGVAALFSCSAEQESFESDRLRHGAFFYHVLEGLRGKAANKDGTVELSRLFAYVTEEVPDAVKEEHGAFARQKPSFKPALSAGNEVIDMVLLRVSRGDKAFRLALEYYYGQGRKVDYVEAARLFQEASNEDNSLATAFLGVLYLWGQGVERNQGRAQELGVKACARVKQAAVNGNTLALEILGMMYREGLGVMKDCAEARRCFSKAAEQNLPYAYEDLGALYRDGQGVERDYAQAFQWFSKAASQNFPYSQHNMGYLYENGLGAEKDYAKALHWFRMAAEQNYADAQAEVGSMYFNGLGVAKDYAEALRWYRLAAAQNVAAAQHQLGALYHYGLGVGKDYAEALRWYHKAAAQNLAFSQYSLGHMYCYGLGVAKDYAESLRWYHKAAAQNFAAAQNELGYMYHNGWGVEKDYAEALRWLRKAAAQNNVDAQNSLGVMYETGQGVPRDLMQAIRWYRLAADQRDQQAAQALRRLGQ
jgi:TPR repeat protein